jgi:hypothetical protein
MKGLAQRLHASFDFQGTENGEKTPTLLPDVFAAWAHKEMLTASTQS